jgi:hypothetical protein
VEQDQRLSRAMILIVHAEAVHGNVVARPGPWAARVFVMVGCSLGGWHRLLEAYANNPKRRENPTERKEKMDRCL